MPGDEFSDHGLKREELLAMNSQIRDEADFHSLGGGGAARGSLGEAIARDSAASTAGALILCDGQAEGGGSGWGLPPDSPHDKRLVNQWAADHTTPSPVAGR